MWTVRKCENVLFSPGDEKKLSEGCLLLLLLDFYLCTMYSNAAEAVKESH